MKEFIQNRLRLMLEGITEGVNEGVNEGVRHSDEQDLERLKYALVSYHRDYSDDPYFMSDSAGDAILRVSINIKGLVATVSTPKAAASIAKSNLGLVDANKDYLVFHVMAGRGIEHPGTYKDRDYDAVTRKGGKPEYEIKSIPLGDGITLEYRVAKPGSPASDAVIKTFMNHGKDIINFVKKNQEGYNAYTDADDSGKEIAADKNDPAFADRMQAKLDKQVRKDTKSVSLPDDISKLMKDKAELNDKFKSITGNDKVNRYEKKKLRDELKVLDKKIKDLEAKRSFRNA